MQSTSSERDPVEVLADEFVQRRRRGETPSLTEYVQRFPKLADEIRAVFPAIVALEKVGPAATEASAGLTPRRAEITRSMAEAIGDYRILREVGRGAMGVVYEAEQQSLDRRVALKVLPWHSVANAKAVERFRREARAAARLHHTNIVPVFDVGQAGEVCYFAMQFIQGQPLDSVLVELRHLKAGVLPESSQLPIGEGERPAAGSLALSMYTEAFAKTRVIDGSGSAPLPGRGAATGLLAASETPASETVTLKHPSTIPGALLTDPKARTEAYRSHYFRSVAHVAERVADALAYAHERGIIHRDIKPSNLMLDAAGVVWVTDFGLAKTNDESLTRTGDLLGTLRYMAPERFDGKCDARADVYSLGATLYELLCLQPARDASDGADLIAQITRSEPAAPRKLDPQIPRDLERIVLKAIERDPRHRYPSAQALAEDLRRFLNDQPILGRRVSPSERFGRWAKRNRALATATVGGIALLLTAVIVSSIASASFSALAKRERKARVETTSNLYHSLFRQAEATRLARREGYRAEAWELLERARNLDTPEVDVDELRREAILSLGDFLGHQPVTLTDFPTDVTGVAASPDGAVVAVGLRNGVIRWYAGDGKLLQENKQHSTAVDRLKFNRSGDLLLSTDVHGAAKAWKKLDDHWQVRELASLGRPVLAIEPVHDGQLIVAYQPLAEYSEIVVQDLAQNRKISIFPPVEIDAVALSRNGNLLAGVGKEDVYVWETRSGAVLERTTTNLGPLTSVTFSQDGKLLFCGSKQGLVVFDLPELQQQTFMRYDEVPLGAFGPEGMHVAFASVNRRITLWSVPANRELAVLLHPGWKDLHSLAFADNGRILVSADGDSVRLWNVRGGPERTVVSGHSGSVNGISFEPGTRRLVSVGLDRNVMAWDLKSGLRTAINSVPVAANVVAHAGDSGSVIVGDAAGTVHVMHSETLKVRQTVDSSLGSIHSIRCSPTDDRVAVVGERGAGIWRLKHAAVNQPEGNDSPKSVWLEKERTLPASKGQAIEFSPDGQFVAWVDARRTIRLLEVEKGIEWPLSCPPLLRGSQNLAFDPTGEHLLAVNQHGQVVGWNVITDRGDFTLGEPGTFQGTHVAVSPRTPWLAVDSLPMQISIWDLSSRKPFFVFREEPSAVNVTTWDSKGRLLAVGSKDGSLAIWNLPALQKELAGIDLDWPTPGEEQAVAEKKGTPLQRLTQAFEKEPKDLKLRLRRASILAAHGDEKAALADLSEILAAQPDHRAALVARANLRAKAGDWNAAAADYQAALHLDQPSTTAEWQTVALLLAHAGQADAYRQHCEAMLERLPEDAPPAVVEKTLLSCILMKSSLSLRDLPAASLQRFLDFGGGRIENRARTLLTLALAAHRRGDSWEAIQLVRRAQDDEGYSKDASLPALSFAILALAQQNEAQTSLARTSLEATRDFKRRVGLPSDAARYADDGHDRLTIDLLENEASELLKP